MSIARAAEILRQGGLVVFPTETVYGLGADAANPLAVARIYEAKGRPRFNPLICHVADLEMAERHAVFDPISRTLAEAFWPGPLTLILPVRPDTPIHPLARAGLDTVGIRVPAGFAGRLLKAFDRPLAAPSANTSGRISPTRADHVEADLGGAIELILDAGPARVGVESTIVKVVDGSETNDHFWFYYGALSNVEYHITVTDTFSGDHREYENPMGSFGSFGDIEAFPAP